jgi:hypothetical protein
VIEQRTNAYTAWVRRVTDEQGIPVSPAPPKACATTVSDLIADPSAAGARLLQPGSGLLGRNARMPGSTFQTNPYALEKLLGDCGQGKLQLPDFQRSWIWDEDRIVNLIASVSRAFPISALMTLQTGGPVNFKPRPIEGAPPEARHARPQSLLLDGQQRMTWLY